MSFKDFLTAPLNESVLDQLLHESVETFADVPSKWKKLLAYKYAGADSEIEVKNSGIIKNKTRFNSIFKTALEDSDSYPGVVIEVDNKPVMLIRTAFSNSNKFQIHFDNGNIKTVARSYRGTNYEDSDLNITESLRAIAETLVQIATAKHNESGAEDDKVERVSDAQMFSELDISIKVIQRDRVRIDKNNTRRDNAKIDSSLTANARTVIKKYTKENIASGLTRLHNDIPSINDIEDLLVRAAEGEEVSIDINSIIDRLKALNAIITGFTSAYKTGKIHYPWDNGKIDGDVSWLKKRIDAFNEL